MYEAPTLPDPPNKSASGLPIHSLASSEGKAVDCPLAEKAPRR